MINLKDRLHMFSSYRTSEYSRYNISENVSDVTILIKEYEAFVLGRMKKEESNARSGVVSFAENKFGVDEITWIQENHRRFLKDTPNNLLAEAGYLSEVGFICCMTYFNNGEGILVGHSTGFVQVHRQRNSMATENQSSAVLESYTRQIRQYYDSEKPLKIWYPMFNKIVLKNKKKDKWVRHNYVMFLKGTQNEVLYYRWFNSEMGAVSSMLYAPDGTNVIVGHASGMIQLRHGKTGTVLSTLRNIQYPPKPIYALAYSNTEERICYAACTDGIVYRMEIPNITPSVDEPPSYCIRADPALECLSTQFYGSGGVANYATPFITQRSPALSLGMTADHSRLVVGYADSSIKVYDIETQEADVIYKVHKMRVQFVPRKMQRLHTGQVCAVRCHHERSNVFASAAWDKTLRIWDIRCHVGCVMTFEGVNVCGDSIDLNRDQCITGSWQPTQALAVWDLTAKRQLNIIRAQNRRPDVDGEYIYSCRYWKSTDYNRKGKYAIIGGSGTHCVEVINLHNRYISCSYPAEGTITAITSYEDRIAFGGTTPVINIVSFHDPKHEKYDQKEMEQEETSKDSISFHEDEEDIHSTACSIRNSEIDLQTGTSTDAL